MTKLLVLLGFIIILGSLFSALFFLMRDQGKSNRTVLALSVRVGVSVLLFVLLLLAHHFGWIESTGLRY